MIGLIQSELTPARRDIPVVTVRQFRPINYDSVRTFGLLQLFRFGRKVMARHQRIKPSQKNSPENRISRMKNVDKR
jgi:hypothetical protein